MGVGFATGMMLWFMWYSFIDSSIVIMDGSNVLREIYACFLGLSNVVLVSICGFIAFVFAKYYILGILKHHRLGWIILQTFFIVLMISNLIILRYLKFEHAGVMGINYWGIALIIALIAGVTAWQKVRLTNGQALLPTLFFMIVMTSLEFLPALLQDQSFPLVMMLVPLLVCNAWQILRLHKVT